MSNIATTVFVGKQAGKTILTGNMKASRMVELLRHGDLAVNAKAQRSLVPGKFKETTSDLIDADRVEMMPRMKNFRRFVERVIQNVENGNNKEGFFGAPQLTIPEEFLGARLEKVEMTTHDGAQVAILRADPMMGECVLHVADGQGRIVGFHSLERVFAKQIVKLKNVIKRKERKLENVTVEVEELKKLEGLNDQIRRFLSTTDISFVCYVDDVSEDGSISGLSEDAEKRLYIEGNALNSQASKEDVIKYEQFSPVVVALQEQRDSIPWMDEDYIEEDSKSISASSNKLFTLSTLVQAYSFSIVGHNKPMQKVDSGIVVEKRQQFCENYWKKIGEIFEPVWLPDLNATPTERNAYLKKERHDWRNVSFSAIFLQALGQLCYRLGKAADWVPESSMLSKLDALQGDDFRAVKSLHLDEEEVAHVDDWNSQWCNSMMKPVTDKDSGEITGYVFNNVTDSVTKTRHLLASKIGIQEIDDPVDEDEAEAA